MRIISLSQLIVLGLILVLIFGDVSAILKKFKGWVKKF